jgi:hypothetical protein
MWVKRITDAFPNASDIDTSLPVCCIHFKKSAFVESHNIVTRVLKFAAMPVIDSLEYCLASTQKNLTSKKPTSTLNP